MTSSNNPSIQIIKTHEAEILTEWLEQQKSSPVSGRVSRTELEKQSKEFLSLFTEAIETDHWEDTTGSQWANVRGLLEDVSKARAGYGFPPSDTANFVLSLKQPIFNRLQGEMNNGASLAEAMRTLTRVLDKLSLSSVDYYQQGREKIIVRQQQELLELSTPVVRLWDNILALPLIGTLDSARTQVVMESLLQQIIQTGSSIAIIDITGVPTVDTLVAQHLLKTVAAARLMGADCIISGIGPQTAQTIVHLGVDLSQVTTKATLADALKVAMQRLGLMVTRIVQKQA